ncbi:hypothetical protein IWQ62_004615 [Dispira parvispora]|uniref:Uncharacterized protein n=1 Tax=Dispira parvispora TaxID=1520584 RepID=A0A9W8E1T5_9FUNG|nr:hypothetical protein IWQ62_004615 [Dispira parvispora]
MRYTQESPDTGDSCDEFHSAKSTVKDSISLWSDSSENTNVNTPTYSTTTLAKETCDSPSPIALATIPPFYAYLYQSIYQLANSVHATQQQFALLEQRIRQSNTRVLRQITAKPALFSISAPHSTTHRRPSHWIARFWSTVCSISARTSFATSGALPLHSSLYFPTSRPHWIVRMFRLLRRWLIKVRYNLIKPPLWWLRYVNLSTLMYWAVVSFYWQLSLTDILMEWRTPLLPLRSL